MSDYKQLRAIYEGGWQGLSRDTSPNDRYTANFDLKNSYKRMGINTGEADNLYGLNSNNTGVVPVESEEERIDGEISKLAIVRKIEELMKVALEDEMMYCVHTLGTLKEFAKKG